MIVAVNYADQPWRKAQRLNTRTAYKKGKVDRVEEYTRDDIAEDFWKKNQGILEKPRGGGIGYGSHMLLIGHMRSCSKVII